MLKTINNYFSMLIVFLLFIVFINIYIRDKKFGKQLQVVKVTCNSKSDKGLYILGLVVLILNSIDLLDCITYLIQSNIQYSSIIIRVFMKISGILTGLVLIYLHKPSLKIKEEGIIYKGDSFKWNSIIKFELKDNNLLFLKLLKGKETIDISMNILIEDTNGIVNIFNNYIND